MAKDNSNILLLGGAAALALFAFGGSSKSSTTTPAPLPGVIPKTPTDFVKLYYKNALQSEKDTGVPALVTLAQAGLESGWGKAAYGNNFFGIKAGSSWKGNIQKLKTWECSKTSDELIKMYSPNSIGVCPCEQIQQTGNTNDDDFLNRRSLIGAITSDDVGSNPNCNNAGKPSYRVYGKFRAYNTPADGFKDHGEFLKNNKRYKKAFDYKGMTEQFAREIAKAGYATAPNYGQILVDTINNIKKILGVHEVNYGSSW